MSSSCVKTAQLQTFVLSATIRCSSVRVLTIASTAPIWRKTAIAGVAVIVVQSSPSVIVTRITRMIRGTSGRIMDRLQSYSTADLQRIVEKLSNMEYMPLRWRKARIAKVEAEIEKRKESVNEKEKGD